MARLLGRESVSSDIAAILELVKNAYDADAENVIVTFKDFKTNDPVIIIEEDGRGLNMQDLEEKWMVIGTDYKEKEPFSKTKRRRVIGNKGVGRFATERLCHKFQLISMPTSSDEVITMTINWDEYDKQNITFNDVENQVSIDKRPQGSEHGTKIILSQIRESWTGEKIDRLRMALNSLVIPEELKKISNDKFNIVVDAEEFETKTSSEISSLLLKHAPYKIISSINTQQSEFRIVIRREGRIILEEKQDLEGNVLETGEEWKTFGKCKFTLYFYPGESRHEKWNKYYKKYLHVNQIINTLSLIHGVKIYRDGIWVRPYGDIGNDWLSLEKERVQANYKLGNSQVIGFVEIGKDQNESIIDTTTRERLVENTEFYSMKEFVKQSIQIVNNHRKELNKRLREKQAKKVHKNILASEIKHFKELIINNDSLTSDDKKKFTRTLNDISEIYSDYEQKTEEELTESEMLQRAYRNLASLGISSATASHEIGHVIGHLGIIPEKILNKLNETPEAKRNVENDVKNLVERINIIRYFMTLINEYVGSLTHDKERKQRKERIPIKSVTETYVENLSGIMRMNNLNIKQKIDPLGMSIFMNKADFSSIILNLFSNSLKSIQKLPDGIERKVKITISKDTKNFKIKFSDNGVGIKPINRDKIFRLFYSTNKGTGLGLPIIKEILEDYEGDIKLSDSSEMDSGATFIISIPLESLKP